MAIWLSAFGAGSDFFDLTFQASGMSKTCEPDRNPASNPVSFSEIFQQLSASALREYLKIRFPGTTSMTDYLVSTDMPLFPMLISMWAVFWRS